MNWNLPLVNIEDYKKHEKQILAAQFMHIIVHKMQAKSINRKMLADQLGVTPNYLSSLFNGKRIPSLELLVSFQYVLGIRFFIHIDIENNNIVGNENLQEI